MRHIFCWALSKPTLRLLAGDHKLPSNWFQWREPTSTHCRISVFDALEPNELARWARVTEELEVNPVVVLGPDEELPDLGDCTDLGTHWMQELLTLRIGDEVDDSIGLTQSNLLHPDTEFLERWAGFVLGYGREFASHMRGESAVVPAYFSALQAWRDDPNRQDDLKAAFGFDLDSWPEGSKLSRQDFADSAIERCGNKFLELKCYPATGLMRQGSTWVSCGLLPVDPRLFATDELLHQLEREIAPIHEKAIRSANALAKEFRSWLDGVNDYLAILSQPAAIRAATDSGVRAKPVPWVLNPSRETTDGTPDWSLTLSPPSTVEPNLAGSLRFPPAIADRSPREVRIQIPIRQHELYEPNRAIAITLALDKPFTSAAPAKSSSRTLRRLSCQQESDGIFVYWYFLMPIDQFDNVTALDEFEGIVVEAIY